jgi:hypothetical protein
MKTLKALTVASLLFAGTGAAAEDDPSIANEVAATEAAAFTIAIYCPDLAVDTRQMQPIDEAARAFGDGIEFRVAYGRYVLALSKLVGWRGQMQWCADALIKFGPLGLVNPKHDMGPDWRTIYEGQKKF